MTNKKNVDVAEQWNNCLRAVIASIVAGTLTVVVVVLISPEEERQGAVLASSLSIPFYAVCIDFAVSVKAWFHARKANV